MLVTNRALQSFDHVVLTMNSQRQQPAYDFMELENRSGSVAMMKLRSPSVKLATRWAGIA